LRGLAVKNRSRSLPKNPKETVVASNTTVFAIRGNSINTANPIHTIARQLANPMNTIGKHSMGKETTSDYFWDSNEFATEIIITSI